MNLAKQDIQQALQTISLPGDGKNLMESGAVKNIVVFGDEVVIDLILSNPSLQARKKVEVEILKCIHKEVHPKAKIKINVTVEAPPKAESIKGNPIPGIDNIIAISSGKGVLVNQPLPLILLLHSPKWVSMWVF